MNAAPTDHEALRLVDEFSAALREADETCNKLGYYPARFEQMLQPDPAANLRMAKSMITSSKIHDGLRRLARMGRLDLSLEAVCLQVRFRSLFTAGELAAAQWRLNQVSPSSESIK